MQRQVTNVLHPHLQGPAATRRNLQRRSPEAARILHGVRTLTPGTNVPLTQVQVIHGVVNPHAAVVLTRKRRARMLVANVHDVQITIVHVLGQ